MMASPWYETWLLFKKLRHAREMLEYNPKVSVIIPAWNEEVGIISTIESLLANTYDNTEIIVVNDGSTDTSDARIKEYAKAYEEKPEDEKRKRLIYFYKENGGKGTALNKGIELSSGEIIITIDADCLVHPRAIEKFVIQFVDPQVMAAVGNVKVGNTNSFVSVVQYLEFLFSFYLKRADSLFGSIYIIGGAAGAFRRDVFDVVGPYNTDNITEDIELTVRIQKAGMKIVYAAEAIIYTEGAQDMKGLLKQRFRWKRGRIDTFIEHRVLFFSTEEEHNKVLSWFVLPMAIMGDTQLLFEIPFIILLYIYAYITADYTPFISSLVIVSFVFFVQLFALDRRFNKSGVYFLAPIAWLMFYLITVIELNALTRSLWSIYHNKEVAWQRWERSGISADVDKDV